MIKNFFKIVILTLILFILIILYFSYFGIETTKFNSIIKNKIKEQNNELDIDLKKVKLHLDLKNISIKFKTKDSKLILNNSNNLELEEISANISISSYLQNKFAMKRLSIISKHNKIKDYVYFYKLTNKTLQYILLNNVIKRGTAKINADLNFNESGKIQNNYRLKGKVSNTELHLPGYKNIKELNFDFDVTDKNYKLEKILFKFKELKFNSNLLNIQKKNDDFFVKGNLKNKKNKINNDTLSLIFKSNLENFDFSNSQFDSNSEFTFNISKKFKIKNLKINSKVNLDELILKYNFVKLKKYIIGYNEVVKLKDNKFQIQYSEQKFLIDGSSNFYIEDDFKNLLNFNILKKNNKTFFESFLNLQNIDIKIDDIGYKKIKNDNASLLLWR